MCKAPTRQALATLQANATPKNSTQNGQPSTKPIRQMRPWTLHLEPRPNLRAKTRPELARHPEQRTPPAANTTVSTSRVCRIHGRQASQHKRLIRQPRRRLIRPSPMALVARLRHQAPSSLHMSAAHYQIYAHIPWAHSHFSSNSALCITCAILLFLTKIKCIFNSMSYNL